MSKPVRRALGLWAGVSASAALAAVGVVALRHALETPQPLKSLLPGEALLYRWRRRSIFYKVLGSAEAPPLILLHTPDIGASAREMQQIMSPLAQTYRVYALDLLGFGLSDRPNGEYSAAMYSALCQDFLRDVVKEPATLLASGLSCNYAVAVAAGSPDLCTALVLISPTALQSQPQPMPLSEFVDAPLIKALLYPLLSTRLGFAMTHSRQQSSRTDFAQFYANTHQLGAEHAAMALLAGKLSEDITCRFETLQQPTLMIWGMQALENQHTIASVHEAAALADPAHHSREVEFIPEAGLAVHEEQPEAVVAAIRRWQAETIAALPARAETRTDILPSASWQQAAQTETAAEPDPLPSAPSRASTAQPQQSIISDEPVILPEEEGAGIPDEPVILPEEPAAPAPLPASSEHEDQASHSSGSAPIMAYCVRCKKKSEMLNARQVTMKNGRLAVRGTCATCGATLNRIGGLS